MAISLRYRVSRCFYVAIVNEYNEVGSNLNITEKRIGKLEIGENTWNVVQRAKILKEG